MKAGIVLFAHGSRDREWARPFEQLTSTVAAKFHGLVRLAYLELMQPSLEEAIDALAKEGVASIRIVPVFLGQGAHVKADLPRLAASCRAKHPRLRIELDPPIGEQAAVIDAIAAAIIR